MITTLLHVVSDSSRFDSKILSYTHSETAMHIEGLETIQNVLNEGWTLVGPPTVARAEYTAEEIWNTTGPLKDKPYVTTWWFTK